MTTTTTPSKYRHVINASYVDSRIGSQIYAAVNVDVPYCKDAVKVTSSDPNWKIKVAKRQSASLAYKRTGATCEVPLHTCRTFTQGAGYTVNGTCSQRYLGPTPDSFTVTDATVRDQALSKIKKKVNSHTGSMNILTPVGELKDLRQTISGVAELSTTLLKTLIDIKKTKGKSALKYASKAWLTYGFGIAPMISDTKAICKSISDFKLRQDHTAKLSGSASRDFITGSKYNNGAGTYGADILCVQHISNVISYRFIAGFNFNIKSSVDYDLASHLHFEPKALISTAWELVPFSWVVDYFSTVGDFLEDEFVATPGNAIYVVECRKFTAKGQNNFNYKATGTSQIVSQNTGVGKFTYFEFERTPSSTLPGKTLRFKTVDEVGKHGITKVLNLASILVGGINPWSSLPPKKKKTKKISYFPAGASTN